MTAAQLAQLLAMYDYKPLAIQAVQKGYRNESYATQVDTETTINLIIYKTEPHILQRIRSAHYVAEHLAAAGFAVRKPLDRRLVRVQSAGRNTYAAIYNYLPGATIPWEAYTMNHLKQLGAELSAMHASLQDLPQGPLQNITDELQELSVRMQQYFDRKEVALAITTKLRVSVTCKIERYGALLSLLAKQPGAQPLHMDFVRGNILFSPESSTVTGVLDFEKAAWGMPVFDIARTLAFLLVDCKYKADTDIRKYFLYSGYHKRGGSTVPPTRLLHELINFFLLHDFYKFLRHNPYESLAENEHYCRTRQLLIDHGMISEEK